MKKILLLLFICSSIYTVDDVSTQVEIESVKLEQRYLHIQALLLRRFKYESFTIFSIGNHNHTLIKDGVKEAIAKLDDEIAKYFDMS